MSEPSPTYGTPVPAGAGVELDFNDWFHHHCPCRLVCSEQHVEDLRMAALAAWKFQKARVDDALARARGMSEKLRATLGLWKEEIRGGDNTREENTVLEWCIEEVEEALASPTGKPSPDGET